MSHRISALRLVILMAVFVAGPNLIGQERPAQDPSEKPRNVKPELKKAYKDWLAKDVTYIITDDERKAFKKLETDDERERFIEEFWRRRDPDRSGGAIRNSDRSRARRRGQGSSPADPRHLRCGRPP